jgi:hypothetical protein
MQHRFAAVVDRPEDSWFALRASEATGLVDPGVFEASRDLERERDRLLRVGAAGQQQ